MQAYCGDRVGGVVFVPSYKRQALGEIVTDGFDDIQNQRARERQLVLLGALLASKELRQSIRNVEGWDGRVNGAINDVLDTSLVTKNKTALKALLEDIGVREWTPENGNPLKLIAEHVRLDGDIGGQLAVVARESMKMFRARNESANDKRRAIERVKEALEELA